MKFRFEPLDDAHMDRRLRGDSAEQNDGDDDGFDFIEDFDGADCASADTAAATNFDYLQTTYTQIDTWLVYFQTRVPSMPPLAQRSFRDLQRNMRLLTRLLRHSRYPRLALIGRRGAGKSSLMNAILCQQVAQPGHVKAQTGKAKILLYRRTDGSGMDVLDTRGLNEGGRPEEADEDVSAVDSIVRALTTCPVDALLFVHKIKVQLVLDEIHVYNFYKQEVDSGIESDLRALEDVLRQTSMATRGCPVIVVLTHCDELDPNDIKRPDEYDSEKLDNIAQAKALFLHNVLSIAPELHQRILGVVPVSCAVVWQAVNEDGEILPHPRRDYRYNMDALMELLLDNVETQAVYRTVQACRANRVKIDFADFLTKTFASIAAVMACVPVPASDLVPVTGLTTYLAYTIARLSDAKLGYEALTPFLGVIGITGVMGFGARYMLSQVMRFFFVSGVSAVISYTMVTAVGKSAVAFFLEKKSDKEVRELFDRVQRRQDDATANVDIEMEQLGVVLPPVELDYN